MAEEGSGCGHHATKPTSRWSTSIYKRVFRGSFAPPLAGKMVVSGCCSGGGGQNMVLFALVRDPFRVCSGQPRGVCGAGEPVSEFGGGGHSSCLREPWIVASERVRQNPVLSVLPGMHTHPFSTQAISVAGMTGQVRDGIDSDLLTLLRAGVGQSTVLNVAYPRRERSPVQTADPHPCVWVGYTPT